MPVFELRPPDKGLSLAKVITRGEIERLQSRWKRHKFYEEDVLRHIYRNYSGGTFIDGGASIGNHTLFFAMYCADRVVAVEPVESSRSHQTEILALNEANLRADVVQVDAALSDQHGWGRMVKAKPIPGAKWPWNVGMWNFELGDWDIEALTLDAIVDQYDLQDVTLVKLDIEGFEARALRGAHELLSTQHPALFIEAYPQKRRREFEAILAPYGYGRGERIRTNMYEFKVDK